MSQLFKFFLNSIPRPWLIRLSYAVRPIIAWLLSGKRYVDPIDGKGFRKFLPYGYENPRENVLAPATFSLERHRLLWLFLKRKTSFFYDRLKVLHVAPEQAFYKRFRNQKNLEYITTDLYSPLADVKADICNLPFKNGEFDVILCNHVLEHIPNDKKAMKELHRVLKKGGWGVFQVPQDLSRKTTFEDDSITDKKERAKIFGQYDHVRIYGSDYFDKLRSVGFKVEEIHLAKSLSKVEIDRFRLAADEIIPWVKKI